MKRRLKAVHTFTFNGTDGSKVEGVRWQNPDGSVGGWVAKTAIIDKTATIDFMAIVGPGVTIGPGEVVKTARL